MVPWRFCFGYGSLLYPSVGSPEGTTTLDTIARRENCIVFFHWIDLILVWMKKVRISCKQEKIAFIVYVFVFKLINDVTVLSLAYFSEILPSHFITMKFARHILNRLKYSLALLKLDVQINTALSFNSRDVYCSMGYILLNDRFTSKLLCFVVLFAIGRRILM